MFKILDADGGGTLDMDEITALFAEAGIYATKEEVADIFANAMRMQNVDSHVSWLLKKSSKLEKPSDIEKKTT